MMDQYSSRKNEIIEFSEADADWFISLANEVGMADTVKRSKPQNVTAIRKLLKKSK